MKNRERGILTVEASAVLTVVVLLILFLFGFSRIYRAQSMISHAVLQASDAVALESYLRESTLNGSESDVLELAHKLTGSTTIGSESLTSLRSANLSLVAKEKFAVAIAKSAEEADKKLKSLGVKNGLDGVDFRSSTVDLNNNDVIIYAKYTLQTQFPVFGMNEIALTKVAKSKTFGEILFDLTTIPNDPNKGTATGGGNYTHGSEVVIVANPNYGYVFKGWDINGDGVPDTSADLSQKVTVTGTKTYVAIFYTDFNKIKLSVNNSNAGKIVKGNGACEYQKSWPIKAESKPGYSFTGWTGYWFKDVNGNERVDAGEYKENVSIGKEYAEYTIPSVEGMYVLTANFKVNQYTITVESTGANNANSKVVNIASNTSATKLTMDYGTKYKLTTAAPSGYVFKGWQVKGTSNLTKEPGEMTVQKDVTYVAVYTVSPSIKITGGSSGGNTTTFTAETQPAGVTVSWSTSNSNIASVSNGKVTAKGGGSVTITASFVFEGKTYSASKNINTDAAYLMTSWCRRDGYNSKNPSKGTVGPSWWTTKNGSRRKNTGGYRFYYNYHPGGNSTDTKWDADSSGSSSWQNQVPGDGVWGERNLRVTYSQLQNSKKIESHKYFSGGAGNQAGYNATNETGYVLYYHGKDLIFFIKSRPSDGNYDYYISKIK